MEVTWQQYVDRMFEEREKLHSSELAQAHRALDLAAINLTDKLAEMNNFRLQLERERSLYLQKGDIVSIKEAIHKMEDRNSNMDGRFWALGAAVAFLSSVLSILTTIATLRFTG